MARRKTKEELFGLQSVDPLLAAAKPATKTPKTPAAETPTKNPTPNSREVLVDLDALRSQRKAERRTGIPDQPVRTFVRQEGGTFAQTDAEAAPRASKVAEGVPEELEEAGAFEEVTPQRTELSPENPMGFIGKIPVVGPMSRAMTSIVLAQQNEFSGKFEGPIDEQSAREIVLRKIRDDSLNEGLTAAESFGTLIESIPIVGALASKWASGLIETPSGNANNVIGEINKVKEAASTGQEKVRNGLEDPVYGLERSRQMEEQVSHLEGRIKALINSSPILIANSDQVNTIEEQILEAKEKIARYKQASSFGYTAELTGTGRVIPTDEQMFYELQGNSKS